MREMAAEQESAEPENFLHWDLPLSVRDAARGDPSFIILANSMYRSAKQLKRNIDDFKRARKALGMQAERLGAAFEDYAKRLEAFSDSSLFTRAASKEMRGHLKILRSPHAFRLPGIAGPQDLEPLEAALKSHLQAYKDLEDARAAFISRRDAEKVVDTEGSLLEAEFELHEKRMRLIQAQLGFSLATNKLSLQLVVSVFRELKVSLKISRDHAANCLLLSAVGAPGGDAEIKSVIASIGSEVKAVDAHAKDEEDRLLRQAGFKFAPGMMAIAVPVEEEAPGPESEPQGAALNKEFVAQRIDPQCSTMFFCAMDVEEGRCRGRVYVLKDALVLIESVFGWKYNVFREDVFFFRARSGRAEIETREGGRVVLFCRRKECAVLTAWRYNFELDPVSLLKPSGECFRKFRMVFEGVFGDNNPTGSRARARMGVVVVDESPWMGAVKTRRLSLPREWSVLGGRFSLHEKIAIESEGDAGMTVVVQGTFANLVVPLEIDAVIKITLAAKGKDGCVCEISVERVRKGLGVLNVLVKRWVYGVIGRLVTGVIFELDGVSKRPRRARRLRWAAPWLVGLGVLGMCCFARLPRWMVD